MTIKHHLDDAILMAYAAGSLPEAFNLAVAAHVSLCDDCRAAVASYDAVGGSLMDNTSAAELSDQSLERALARLDVPAVKTPTRKAAKPGTLPAPLQDYVGGDLESIKWRPIGMGVKQAILSTSSDATARLLYIPAGVAMPDHSHSGNEMTLVLQGAFFDEDDRFARGDVEFADGSVTHTPVADIGEDCICLAVTDAPLQFKGWLPRIVQRFVGI
ncbi:MAG: ChrR family anti-sigma-E factor [Sulfitobacter sp.]